MHTLLSVGAEVDHQKNIGGSPLILACHQGHMEVVRALLPAGAKADLRNCRPEVVRLMQQVREERALARTSNKDPEAAAVDPNGSAALDPKGAAVADHNGAAAVDPGAAAADHNGAAAVDLLGVDHNGAAVVDLLGAAAVDAGASAVDPGDAAAVDPAHGHDDHNKAACSQLQPGCQDGGACSL